jgi:ABC-type polysaccharide/polyol phosphate export permease
VLALNPMTGVITGCRGSILDMGFSWKATVASVLVAFGVFLVGCAYFRRVERQFADII